jgi:hypothetical protein
VPKFRVVHLLTLIAVSIPRAEFRLGILVDFGNLNVRFRLGTLIAAAKFRKLMAQPEVAEPLFITFFPLIPRYRVILLDLLVFGPKDISSNHKSLIRSGDDDFLFRTRCPRGTQCGNLAYKIR